MIGGWCKWHCYTNMSFAGESQGTTDHPRLPSLPRSARPRALGSRGLGRRIPGGLMVATFNGLVEGSWKIVFTTHKNGEWGMVQMTVLYTNISLFQIVFN